MPTPSISMPPRREPKSSRPVPQPRPSAAWPEDSVRHPKHGPGSRPERPAAGIRPGHPDRLPVQPTIPDGGAELAGEKVEREPDGAVVVRRVAGRHGPLVDEVLVAGTAERRPTAEVLPEALERTVV